jgi:hypothetical protein
MPIASVRINPPQMRTVFGVRQEEVVIESRQSKAQLSPQRSAWRQCRCGCGGALLKYHIKRRQQSPQLRLGEWR